MKSKQIIFALVIGLIAAFISMNAFSETTPPAAPAAGAEVPGFTQTPALDKIPNAPIKGVVNGRPFEGKAVYFEPYFGKWKLVIAEKALKEATDLLDTCQYFNIDIDEPPAAGKKLAHPWEFGKGYLQVQKTDKPGDNTSWNTENAWVLEITKWDVKPYDEKGKMFQQAGTASGHVYITYGGGTDIKQSWAAGTFTDVPVRFMGKPEFDFK